MPFETRNPTQDTAEYRAELLLRQRAGKASVRALAEEIGRSKSWTARALALAREEERAAFEAEQAARCAKPKPDPDPKPGFKVWVLDNHGLHRGGAAIDRERFNRLSRRANSSDAATAIRAARELERLTAQANLRAGLSADGMATYVTALGRGAYDVYDPSDVERVRGIIRDDEIRAGACEELAEHLAQTWQPARPPR